MIIKEVPRGVDNRTKGEIPQNPILKKILIEIITRLNVDDVPRDSRILSRLESLIGMGFVVDDTWIRPINWIHEDRVIDKQLIGTSWPGFTNRARTTRRSRISYRPGRSSRSYYFLRTAFSTSCVNDNNWLF